MFRKDQHSSPKAPQTFKKELPLFLEDLPMMQGRRKEDHGVIIAADQVTPKKHVGKYTGSPLIGSQTRRRRHEHLWQTLKGKKEVPMILLSLAKNKWSGCKRCLAKDHPLTPLSQPDPLLREVTS